MNISLFSTWDVWWEYYTKYDEYKKIAEEEEELVQFLKLEPDETGCGVDIFVDDGMIYEKYNHPHWLYFRNGKMGDGKPFEVLPMSVSKNPQILVSDYILNISEDDLYSVKEFIKVNYEELVHVTLGYLSQKEFGKSVKRVRNAQEIFEMSRLMPKDSNLPVQIWIDDTGTQYGSHHNGSLRIKFAPRKGDVKTREMIPITVDKTNPVIPDSVLKTNPEARNVDKKILHEVQRFIIVNYEPLKQVLMNQINYKTQFLYRICTSYDSHGNPIYPKLTDYTKTGAVLGSRFYGVISNLGSLNYVDRNGNLISDDWFDNVKENNTGEPNVLAYAYVADKKFKIHNNGYAEYIDERPFMERYREDKLKESLQEIDYDFWNIGGIGNLY